ncbi:MAG: KpsF/GutQ family sugar-phosphate isomerase [Planctomycetota bacterium]
MLAIGSWTQSQDARSRIWFPKEQEVRNVNAVAAHQNHVNQQGIASPIACLDSPLDQVRFLRSVVLGEAEVLGRVADQIGLSTARAARWTAETASRPGGRVVVTGMGKAGLIGQKLAATLNSLGIAAQVLHPSEAVHGDLGCIREGDLVWAFSNSGRSQELNDVAPLMRTQAGRLVAFTASEDNPLARLSDCVVTIGRQAEVCPLGLAPSSSTTALLAMGDAVAMLAGQLCGFTPQDFAKFHPGGALGQKFVSVQQMMRPLDACRVSNQSGSVRETIMAGARGGRRTGAVMLVDDHGAFVGLFTDSDLARMMEQRDDAALDSPISDWMTTDAITAHLDQPLSEAISLLADRQISELPVLRDDGCPAGLLDITDVLQQR